MWFFQLKKRLPVLLNCLTSGEILGNNLKKYYNNFAFLCRQQKKCVVCTNNSSGFPNKKDSTEVCAVIRH